MKHYGDITKINGADVPIVDIICGGSPCQDLSVAGRREGLSGERSGLFMEQIRIVKEQRDECIRQLRMRGADIDVRSVRPRWLIWENVPGAFSSNKGEDFRCVLEEICRIADKTANVPMPEKGKWSSSGTIMGDGWSVAWRVHDAQFWGVPQRRKRISVVADFGGESAPEVLFERKSVLGDTEPGEESGQGTSRDARKSTDTAVCFEPGSMSRVGGHYYEDQKSGTIRANAGDNQLAVCIGNGQVHDAMSPSKEVSKTLNCMEDPMKVVTYGVDCYNQTQTEEVVQPIRSKNADSDHIPCVYGLDRASFNQGQNAKFNFSVEEELAPTLVNRGPGGVVTK